MIDVNFDSKIVLSAYRNLLQNKDRYLILWGGRDSGKSHFATQKSIIDCLRLPYYRCILVKKTYESIKDSQYQSLVDTIHQFKLEGLFNFKTSPLEITCVNGNKFIARGCDKPEKLKSIKDPSHIWYEEANHLEYEDFATITSTVRGGTENQEIFSFNPEYNTATLEEFWIYKMWFKDQKELSFSATVKINIGEEVYELPYTVLHTDYNDNPYCKPERIAILESYKAISSYMYDVFAKGLWTVRKIASPFITAFDRTKHLSDKTIFNPERTIYLSFDFNVDNTVCIFSHHWTDTIHIFDGVQAPDLPQLLEKIKVRYGKYSFNFKITGDFSGTARNSTSGTNITSYILMKRIFNIKDNQFVIRKNPEHKPSRFVCNTILMYYPTLLINPSLKELIYDIENVECDKDEKLVKKDRNIANQKSDWLDAFRYYLQNFHVEFIKKYR